MKVRFLASGLGALLGIGLCAAEGRADEPVRVKLAYSAATDATCPAASVFRDLVTARLGYDPFRDDASSLVSVVIEPGRKGVLIGTVTVEKSRELVGRDGECGELAQALAVALAIQLDPFGEQAKLAKAAPLPPPPPPSEAPPPAIAVPPPPGAEAPPPVLEPPTLRSDLSAAFLVGIGVLPGPALGAAGRLAFARGNLSAGAGLRYVGTPGTATVHGEEVSGSLLTGTLDGCATWSVLTGCAIANVGSFSAEAETVAVPRSRSAFYLDLGARVAARVPLGPRYAIEVFLEGHVPFTAPELYVDGQTIFRSTSVHGVLGVGPVLLWR